MASGLCNAWATRGDTLSEGAGAAVAAQGGRARSGASESPRS